MARTAQPPNDDDVRAQRDVDEVFSLANPNPERVGCPSVDELKALASRRLPLGSPGYEHLSTCSPCYVEFRSLQQREKSRQLDRSRRVPALAFAAALFVVAVAATWLTRSTVRNGAADTSVAATAIARATVDLRRFTVTRSEQAGAEQPALRMEARVMDLTLLLPVGAEAGDYDVRLLDSASRTLSEATGRAAIENYVTTLRVRMDLRGMKPGEYQLATRRLGDNWRMYPVALE